ncbi:MAG: hypothetical protein K2Z81_18400, partial [Cyanobacteria bacterium]|nr:hypothetical protein [Cyanobacteriota bacterium]
MKVEEITLRSTGWTLDEALTHLRANPHDAAVQYIALVLAARAQKGSGTSSAFERVQQLLPVQVAPNRNDDLLSIFGGSAAVQESLQLDAMVEVEQTNVMRAAIVPAADKSLESRPSTKVRAKKPFQHMRRRSKMLIDMCMRNVDESVPVGWSSNLPYSRETMQFWNKWASPWFDDVKTLWTALASATGFADLELTIARDGRIISVRTLETLGGPDFKNQIDECVLLLDQERIFMLPETAEETARMQIFLGAFVRPHRTDPENADIDFHPTVWFADYVTWDTDKAERYEKWRKRYSYCLEHTQPRLVRAVPVVEAPPLAVPSLAKAGSDSILIENLHGPAVASHPWKEMLKGRVPPVSKLSRLVPEDFFLIESRSAEKLTEALAAASSWQEYMLSQVQKQAVDQKVVERIEHQLLIDNEMLERLSSNL